MSVDINTWHRLTNAENGSSFALDVANQSSDHNQGTVHLAKTQNLSGQYWHVAQQADGTYHLTSQYLGEKKLLGTFTTSSSSTNRQVHLEDPSSDVGQSWQLLPQDDGTFKMSSLSSDSIGTKAYLDYCADLGTLCMRGGDSPGQHWTLTPIQTIKSSDPAYCSTTPTAQPISTPAISTSCTTSPAYPTTIEYPHTTPIPIPETSTAAPLPTFDSSTDHPVPTLPVESPPLPTATLPLESLPLPTATLPLESPPLPSATLPLESPPLPTATYPPETTPTEPLPTDSVSPLPTTGEQNPMESTAPDLPSFYGTLPATTSGYVASTGYTPLSTPSSTGLNITYSSGAGGMGGAMGRSGVGSLALVVVMVVGVLGRRW